jgi:DNA repair exonuclease SbcCD ATPase subunit
MIKQFKISKLFGFRDVDISFDEDIKILIGENGLGKTTILNSLYYLLSKKFYRLSQIDFETIFLMFKNNEIVEFTKEDLNSYLNFEDRRNTNIRKRISSMIDISEILITDIDNEEQTHIDIENYIRKNPDLRRFAPISTIRREIASLIFELKFNKLSESIKIIDNNIDDILYFPTYRRVEEELKNLGKYSKHHLTQRTLFDDIDDEEYEIVDDDIDDDTLIHFGMEDVRVRIDKVVSEIKQSSIIGFSKVTGEMLSQLLKGFPRIEDKDIEDLDINTVKIVVHRVGQYLNERDRETILSLLENLNELKKKKELVYFIFKLIEIYEDQKQWDDAIKQFKDACNNYLVDKEFSILFIIFVYYLAKV